MEEEKEKKINYFLIFFGVLFLLVILRIAYVRYTDYSPIMPPIDVDTASKMLSYE